VTKDRALVTLGHALGATVAPVSAAIAKGYRYVRWKESCSKHAKKLLGISDLLDASDPYKVLASMPGAYAQGTPPRAFVEETFAKDITRQEHDDMEQTESLQHEFEEGLE
jgi:hypothetical protein